MTLPVKDAPPIHPVMFGRAHGFEPSRIKVIVANYRARTLSREIALENLKRHGVTGEDAETMLGPDSGPIVAGIVAPPEENLQVQEPNNVQSIKRGRGRPRKDIDAGGIRLP